MKSKKGKFYVTLSKAVVDFMSRVTCRFLILTKLDYFWIVLLFNIYISCGPFDGVVVSVLDSRPRDPGFNSRPVHCQAATLGKLLTPMCLCHQAVQFGTSQRVVMLCGREGNRRSGVALAMRHRLYWVIHLRAHGHRKVDEHPINTLDGVWSTSPYHLIPGVFCYLLLNIFYLLLKYLPGTPTHWKVWHVVCLLDWYAWPQLKRSSGAYYESILMAGKQRMISGWTASRLTFTHSAGQRLSVMHWKCHNHKVLISQSVYFV